MRTPIIGALVLAGAVIPAAAWASRPATAPQAEFIIEAIERSKVGGLDRIPLSWYEVTDIRVSTRNPRYAAAFIDNTPRSAARLQPTDVLLEQVGGAWRVLDLDTIPCNIAPRAVLVDLFKGCVPVPGPAIRSFSAPRSVTCRTATAAVRVRWQTRGALAVSFAVDGQPLSAAAGYPVSGTGTVPVPCDGRRHDVELWAFGDRGAQAGPARRFLTTRR